MTPAAFAQEDDAVLKPAEPDFTLIGLPTSLRLPNMKGTFRVTHRFARPLGEGDFGDLANDLFGLDNGAIVGLEFRFGIAPSTQVGIHRSANGKTIEFFGEYGVARQTATMPVEIGAWIGIEGINNFRDEYSPSIGVVLTRLIGETAAVHLQPIFVGNTNPFAVGDNNTFIVGVGARLRLLPTVYVVGEIAPRIAGFKPGVTHGGFGIEKRVGGHVFQVNFSNSWSTTMGQIARGGFDNDDWYLGFNISRKFY
jgi:hypothetical protein